MSRKKVTLRIEEGEVELLKGKFNTDNQSEAIRLAIMKSLATEDSEKVKTLFPYIGKKPPRIGRERMYSFMLIVHTLEQRIIMIIFFRLKTIKI